MKKFLDQNFLLQNKTAEELYHTYAAPMPVIDYHCHLDPAAIADNRSFRSITEAWLNGDHYKWRAMRANGITEEYITGARSPWEKFEAWASTVPYTLRNPLYHWTHLELQRYFDITEILSPKTAKSVYDDCNNKLATENYKVRNLIDKMDVRVICTTDDPLDTLEHHKAIKDSDSKVEVFPSFRPDKAMNADDVIQLNNYIKQLEDLTNSEINNYDDYLSVLKTRHDYFALHGCCVSDHGLEEIYAEDYTGQEINTIFKKIRLQTKLSATESVKFKSAMLYEFALWDHQKGWVQQFHLGALRNNNERAYRLNGPDTGYDSIGDFKQGRSLSKFLNRLDSSDQLAKTIIYNLNPADNELMAAMVGNYNDGKIAGKMQFGSAWWFLDQKDGMTRQLNALSSIGLLSRMVGMLTDSRSFLSFPRHEYFRRILCNLLAQDIENGEMPYDIEWTGKIVQDICYNNAKKYFNF